MNVESTESFSGLNGPSGWLNDAGVQVDLALVLAFRSELAHTSAITRA